MRCQKDTKVWIFVAISIPCAFYLGAILSHTTHYRDFRDHNENLVRTECNFTAADIIETTCFDPCQCVSICDEEVRTDCQILCQQCSKKCFLGLKTIDFSVRQQKVIVTEILDEKFDTFALANKTLFESRPIGIPYDCFYSRKDLNDIYQQPIAAFHLSDLAIAFYSIGALLQLVLFYTAIIVYSRNERERAVKSESSL